MYRVIQILRAHTDGCRLQPYFATARLVGHRSNAAFKHSGISGHFPSRWSHASTYICKAEKLAFTDCDYC